LRLLIRWQFRVWTLIIQLIGLLALDMPRLIRSRLLFQLKMRSGGFYDTKFRPVTVSLWRGIGVVALIVWWLVKLPIENSSGDDD
jgi:hypothetical protein